MSPMLSIATNLVTLLLQKLHRSAYFHPNDFIQLLSFVPQLETLRISFLAPVPNRDVERHLLFTSMTTHVTLPSLPSFGFKGFMGTTENLSFRSAKLMFHREAVFLRAYPQEGAKIYALYLQVGCNHLDWQVSSAAQNLQRRTVHRRRRTTKPTAHFGVGRSAMSGGTLVALELLPALTELSYPQSSDAGDGFTAFVDGRRSAGRPVKLARRKRLLPPAVIRDE
ncbi:hypothetical protein BC826DRAFT_1108980 [Russula brevipes]|nr:hypothetical protein BC826DRAFT_1108980 [Russula brevipes]